MKISLSKNTNILTFGLPLLLILALVALVKSPWFQLYPKELSLGITLDLLLTVPIVYFLLIRKKDIPKITVLSSLVLGIVLASFIIPEEHQFLLEQVKLYVVPVIEIGVFTFVFITVRKTIKKYKIEKDKTIDFYTAILNACKEIIPAKIAPILATEISVIYYSFFDWKTRKLADNEYSYNQKNGISALLYTFIFVIFIETFAIHLVVEGWSTLAAWILSILSLYTGLQIFALIRSMSKRPITIDFEEEKLFLKYGIFSDAIINLATIERVELTSKLIEKDKKFVQLSPLGELSSHNIILHLKNENILNGFYGIKKTFHSIAIYVDKKEEFKSSLENYIKLN
jgi:hypothetical protein